MEAPGFWDNPKSATQTTQRASSVREKLKQYSATSGAVNDLLELWDLVQADHTEEDKEWVDFEEELAAATVAVDLLEIESLLENQYDDQPALVTIHAGAGGVDSCDWAENLYRMYAMWAQREKLTLTVTDERRGDVAGVLAVTFRLAGRHAYGYMKVENGVHRLVRISPFDKTNKRHTSFASVDVVPEIPENFEVEINEDDVKMDVFRASGAGGQHVNKASTAVRLTHLPTRIVVSCQNERSQLQNRQVAMVQLKSKLAALMEQEHKDKVNDLRGDQADIGWGNQIRSYVLHPYQLVKDLRTGHETSNAQRVLDGDLNGFIWSGLRWLRESKGGGE